MSLAAARVTVDSATGKVAVQHTGLGGRAVYGPGSVGLTSEELVDAPGSTGQKVLTLWLKNAQEGEIGGAGGIRVTLSGITNLAATPTDVSSRTTVATLAGDGTAGASDGPALGPVINTASGLLVLEDAIYFSSKGEGKVKKLSSGKVTTVASGLLSPTGLATDGAYSLLVAETGRNRVVRIPLEGGTPIVVAGAANGASGDVLGAGSVARFNAPIGLALVSYRTASLGMGYRLYVADSLNNKVKIIEDPLGVPNVTTSVAAPKPQHLASGSAGASRVVFATGKDHVIQACIDSSAPGSFVTIAGTGAAGSAEGIGTAASFNDPQGIAWTKGALYVADRGNGRIRQLTLQDGGSVASPSAWKTALMAGTSAGTHADGAGTVSSFVGPEALAVSDGGLILVGDTHRLRSVNGGQLPITVGGDGGPTPTSRVTVLNPDGFSAQERPYFAVKGGLSPDSSQRVGPISFAVPDNVRLFQFDVLVEGQFEHRAALDARTDEGSPHVHLQRLAGDSLSGHMDGPGVMARFNGISSIAAVGEVLYVADRLNHSIRRVDANGRVATILGGPTKSGAAVTGTGAEAALPQPTAIWMKSDETEGFAASTFVLYRLVRTGPDPALMSSWTLQKIAGSTVGSTEGNGTLAKFNGISSILSLSPETLLVADTTNGKLRRITQTAGDRSKPESWSVSTFASGLPSPMGLSTSLAGDIFLSSNSFAGYQMTPNGLIKTIFGKPGTIGTADGVFASARFGALPAVASDAWGYVYFLDKTYGKVRRGSLTSGLIQSVVKGGVSTGVEGPGTTASLTNTVSAMVMLPDGDLVVGDSSGLWTLRRVIAP